MPEISLPTKATQDLIKTETDKIASKASQTTVDTINTKAGTNADAGGTTTLFARLKQIYDYLVSNLSSTRASKIDNLDTTITSRAAQTTANAISTNVGSNADVASATGSVHAKLKDLKAVAMKPRKAYRTVSASTSSTTLTALLNLSGAGRLKAVNLRPSKATGGTSYKVILDGTTFNDSYASTTSTWLAPWITGAGVETPEYVAYDFEFKESCVVQVRVPDTSFSALIESWYELE